MLGGDLLKRSLYYVHYDQSPNVEVGHMQYVALTSRDQSCINPLVSSYSKNCESVNWSPVTVARNFMKPENSCDVIYYGQLLLF